MPVYRIYVEKKEPFAVEAHSILSDVKTSLQLENLEAIRVINRYDVEGISEETFKKAQRTVFSEPSIDDIYFECPTINSEGRIFAIEYLPGQFDQRADSCAQCIQILVQGDRPVVKNARVYVVSGNLTDDEFQALKAYLINPVESREASLATVNSLDMKYDVKTTVKTLDGFIDLNKDGLASFINEYGLAMDLDDIIFCQSYFKDTEKRNPTITEIKMIDTYWSDHCRHTTFSTNIDKVTIHDDFIKKSYEEYKSAREVLYKGRTDKPITLMDLAVIGAKKLKKDGILTDLDESEEINACSVKIKVDVDGVEEDWLLMFKNETHNHPTEIEPFGGAATCLGGAIRDPLSGRSYVYQAMRVTGAANPLVSLEDTISGKLPQKKIVTGAAAGYSSYGNQIGLATGQVNEIYHDGYVAKRMEIGAVMGATPAKNVVREVPEAGDVVILLGGKTGRDGCGGATGSSKSHTLESLESCGAEVQKGNAPEERKIQRLFRNSEVTRLIRRCNDFGAGGVSVAIGELADGLEINLDAVPKKYNGLDGTELAISESQERMACVVRKSDMEKFIALAQEENLEATFVATVTETPRLKMDWNGKRIVDLSREFLNSNGAVKHTEIEVAKALVKPVHKKEITAVNVVEHLCDLNMCSQKGLVERFDSTIGSGSVLMPFGGEYQLTPTQAMVAKIPVLYGETQTASVMGWGFNPYISEQSPYHGAMYAVIESIAKVVATGGSHHQCWLTFQEYFERTQNNPVRWGKPFAALLGAYKAQIELGIGAIGGKDSMSGTFENIDVPPTLCSFAVSVTKTPKVVSPEFKRQGNRVIMIIPEYDANGIPCFDSIKACFDKVESLISQGVVNACSTLTYGGVIEAVAKMALGNKVGMKFTEQVSPELMFNPVYGGFILEVSQSADVEGFTVIGTTTSKYIIVLPNLEIVDMRELQKKYEKKLEPIFPYRIHQSTQIPTEFSYKSAKKDRISPAIKVAKPKVLIPVFPGTNCEYDSARAFEKAGADAEIFVIKNLTSAMIEESIKTFASKIDQAQMIMIPGGFSGGDEPDGSAKFIVSFFKNPQVKEAVQRLLQTRDGLMVGICNGFQALIKLGLVPYGDIVDMDETAPTLTFNTIGRHQSMMVNTRISSNKSPWLYNTQVGDIHAVPISHGEGRFIADTRLIEKLAANGQVATQYVDLQGQPTYDIAFNPNESAMAIEGITSPDGRVFGKMAHSERIGTDICKNIYGNKDQMIFKSGVEYFTK
ncbi:phosphoribosylformylglycinamidine synthase [Paludicola sp. MB14-C6]|uniref:phosphoribosylformylglycinamidine synthase n=1 Tax=Paludihabitans sp. MB14-C6 TaxID=3070656 RepID=UPI0027DB851B|nr:phosphoribosylformylglycinamidine synthase [Paludicola sp. MB14-C6]WMJ22291.1 phosphoribosylformylglycinamidine synthase [Paludicola sp. MB14-C6]